ncbi:Nif3-like dinuclear metal center hexameric protein [Deltaproteobacteria bacterium]|nr:Nif3-like dinuclear metal center hexameric protein [Deltaproteobacteria bacterium]
MIPKLQDILNLLDEMAPFSMAEEWDNSGLQVGRLSRKVKRVLVALDPTIKAVKYASDRKAQLLLTHHPLIFKPLSCINPEIYPGDVVNEALKKDISIIAVHTNLDAVKGGINDILARLFGLKDVKALQKNEGSDDDREGMGRIGDLSRPMKLSGVTEIVKEALGAERLMVMGPGEMRIRRVAVVGGSGGGMALQASRKGADLLVTGDIKHHEALAAESLGLALIDGGHFYTERAALNFFADFLREKLKERGWDVVAETYEDEKEPMRYE